MSTSLQNRRLETISTITVWLGIALALGTRVSAASDAMPVSTTGLRLRSITVLPRNFIEPQMAFDRTGSVVWLAQAENDGLRLRGRDADGRIVHEATAPGLALRQPPMGIAATEDGMVVYGDSPGKSRDDEGFAYVQFFDRQGVPAELRVYHGAIRIRAVSSGSDGGLAMLLLVYGKATIQGVSVHGPESQGQAPPLALLMRVDASGKLLWSRMLDEEHAKRDPWIVGAADGRLALLLSLWGVLPGAPGSRAGGAMAFLTADGELTWAGQRLAAVSGAAFDQQGTLWTAGDATMTGPPPRLLPAQDVPQVLDAYRPELDRQVICPKGCISRPQLTVDGVGDVFLLAAVTHPTHFDGVALPATRPPGESWSLLQIRQHRVFAHHTLTATHAHLAAARDGKVAVIATGVRGPTTLDKRRIGKPGETLLIQFER